MARAGTPDAARIERISRDALAAAQPAGQRLALEVLHDEVRALVGVEPDVVDLGDAGVLDARDGAGLVEEPLHRIGVGGDLRVEDLDRDARLDRRVLGDEDLAHATAPCPRNDLEMSDRLADHAAPL